MIKLYHGSNILIKDIDLSFCNPYKDFGRAFYLTSDEIQAIDVARARVDIFGGTPVINTFYFDEALLKDGHLMYKSFLGYTEEWADFIFLHRDESNIPPYQHPFDVVYGDQLPMIVLGFRFATIA